MTEYDEAVALGLAGTKSWLFIVSKRNRVVLWRWQHGKVVQDILELRTMEPGAELAFTGEWDRRDIAGEGGPSW